MRSGLRNLGNTCFMNAALQCITHSPELASELVHFLKTHDKKRCPATLICHKLIEELQNEKAGPITPNSLRRNLAKAYPYMTDGSQHDAHEFFMLYLQLLEEEQNKLLNANKEPYSTPELVFDDNSHFTIFDSELISTIIKQSELWWNLYSSHNPNVLTNVYYGEMATQIRCLQCNQVSIHYSAFNTIYVPLPCDRYQITVNMAIQYATITAAHEVSIQVQLIPVSIVVSTDSLLSKVSEQLKRCIQLTEPLDSYDFVFVKGTYNYAVQCIEYTYIDDSTEIQEVLSSDSRSTLIAYFIPFTFCHPDYHHFLFLNCASLQYQNNSSFIVRNGCLPLVVIIQEKELLQSLLSRVQVILNAVFSRTKASSADKKTTSNSTPILIDTAAFINNIFFTELSNAINQDVSVDETVFILLRSFQDTRIDLSPSSSVPTINLKTKSIDAFSSEQLIEDVFTYYKPIEKVMNRNMIFSITSITGYFKCSTIPSSLQTRLEPYLKSSTLLSIIKAIPLSINNSLATLQKQHIRFPRENVLRLQDCFDFCSVVEPSEICSNCHEKKEQEMKQHIVRLPPILVILLKRFSYSSSKSMFNFGSMRNKITEFVDFPLTDLDMSPFTVQHEEASYDLIAVCNHSGTADYGHYYAYCLETINGINKWYEYNDTYVHEIKCESVKTSNAYILFYRRHDLMIQTPQTNGRRHSSFFKDGLFHMSSFLNLSPNQDDTISHNTGTEGSGMSHSVSSRLSLSSLSPTHSDSGIQIVEFSESSSQRLRKEQCQEDVRAAQLLQEEEDEKQAKQLDKEEREHLQNQQRLITTINNAQKCQSEHIDQIVKRRKHCMLVFAWMVGIILLIVIILCILYTM